MTFIELLRQLENQLGNHHLPLNPNAGVYKELFEGIPVHHDVIRELIGAIYAANGCRRLTDPVDKEKCFAAVGPQRRDVLKRPTADVDVYRLLDDFCQALDQSFGADPISKKIPDEEPPVGEIVQLDTGRRRK